MKGQRRGQGLRELVRRSEEDEAAKRRGNLDNDDEQQGRGLLLSAIDRNGENFKEEDMREQFCGRCLLRLFFFVFDFNKASIVATQECLQGSLNLEMTIDQDSGFDEDGEEI